LVVAVCVLVGMRRMWRSDSSAVVHWSSTANHSVGNCVASLDADDWQWLALWTANIVVSQPV